MSFANHATVSETRFRVIRMAAAAFLVAMTLISNAMADDASDPLVVVGSGNMAGFLRGAAQPFGLEEGVQMAVEASTSSAGPPALLQGRAGLASMSRRMNDDEMEAFRVVLGAEPPVVTVGIDAVAIFVNRENPLREITIPQLDAIFSERRLCGAEAAITMWRDLGVEGSWANREIGLYGHVPSSGTHAFFRERVLCGGAFREGVRNHPGAKSVILSIAESAFGMGYAARADQDSGIRPLAVTAVPGGRYGTISSKDVYAGHYPLARDLFLYRRPWVADDPQAETARAFVAYMLSDAGQEQVELAGFLRLPADRLATERAKLEP